MRLALWIAILLNIAGWSAFLILMLYSQELVAATVDPKDPDADYFGPNIMVLGGIVSLAAAWLAGGVGIISALVIGRHQQPWPRLLWVATAIQLGIPTLLLTTIFIGWLIHR